MSNTQATAFHTKLPDYNTLTGELRGWIMHCSSPSTCPLKHTEYHWYEDRFGVKVPRKF